MSAPTVTPELKTLLRRVKLGRCLDTLPERLALAQTGGLGHAEFLELVLADEVTRRETTSADRRARAAALDPTMTLDRWDDTAKITYDHTVWNELCSLRFVDAGHNAVIMGPVGVGKTFLATALGHAAVRRRFSVHFERCDRLLKRLRASRLDNSHDLEMRKLLRVDLLIIDDFALQPLDALDTADVYELIVERHRAAATVVTSNREPIEWPGLMADALLAQSAIGRFTTGVPDEWKPRPGCLGIAEREEILVGLRAGESLNAIARRLGRSASTISREVAANGGRESYSAWSAHQRARGGARRSKPCKLRAGRLCDEVARRLLQLWSPDEIARRLPLDFPDDPEMRMSHETIYQSLFVQGRGELRRELARCLRSGRTARKKRGAVDRRGRIPGMVNISERPAEVADRAVPGHWEGDLILGEGGRSAVGTLVERSTRLVLLLHLEDGRSAVNVEAAMPQAVATLPGELRRSITWDQGAEMSTHASFTTATGIPIYFCDPHAPWQRGSNENTNGLLRQYMPKGTDLSKHSAADLKRIQRSLNDRPRKTLGYMTPSEAYAQVVAATA